MIYFAEAADRRIKIGTAQNVEARLKQVGAHLPSPLIHLGSIEGGHRLERAIHDHLAEHRLNGEWFADCETVRRTIRNLILAGGLAIGFTEVAKPAVTRSRSRIETSAFDPMLFAKMVRLLWGDVSANELASLAEVCPDVALGWISGSAVPPRIVRLAVFGLFIGRISRLDGDPESSSRAWDRSAG